MKKFLAVLVLFGLATMLFAACGGGATQANGPNPVHMNDVDFVQHTITIKKGESITLINDVAAVHVITNGTWDNNTPKTAKEPGAPKVEDLIQGYASQTTGPFNTAGTFHLFCTTHANMNLTVIVQ